VATVVFVALALALFLHPGLAKATGCVANPSACGYPDATNSGVPAGTPLTAVGSMVAATPGQVISARSVAGTITVAADNVTIVNTQVLPPSGGSGSAGIMVESGVEGTVFQNVTVGGPGGGSQSLQAAIRNSGSGTVAQSVYLYNCSDCWEGQGSIRDSYMRVDSIYPDAHAEDLYVCGGSIEVSHSTLLNAVEQTATVFGDTANCGGNNFVVSHSLLAGGGYVLYPQANSSSRTGTMTVVGNRIGRCTSAPVFVPRSGGTVCAGGADEGGFQPRGGYFGVAAYYYLGDAQDIWEGNVWADSSAPVCPDGSSGCPALIPSSEPLPLAPWRPVSGGAGPALPPSATTPGASAPPARVTGRKAKQSGPHATFKLADVVKAGRRVKLVGRFPGGVKPISCRWVLKRAASGRVVARQRGCRTTLRFRRPGSDYLILNARDAQGRKDILRQKVDVRPR
jgi:hypothetical protein